MKKMIQVMFAIVIGIWGIMTWETLFPTVTYQLETINFPTYVKFANKSVYYKHYETLESLQAAIDKRPNTAGTCYFQVEQDNYDNQSSYFAGHDKDFYGGCFEELKKLSIGDTIEVQDHSGTVREYHITHKFIGHDDTTQWTADQYREVFQTQTEQIVLQTCVGETHNQIVVAR
jgi:hypothetical protein